jgi:hypothetical protein
MEATIIHESQYAVTWQCLCGITWETWAPIPDILDCHACRRSYLWHNETLHEIRSWVARARG